MLKFQKVKENYEKKLEEYQMYYTDSIALDDKSLKKTMAKQAEYTIPQLKYYEGQFHSMKALIQWLEGAIKSYNDSQSHLYEIQADPQRAKKMYGSLRNVKEAIISESAKRVALENMLTYLKS